MPGQYDLRGQRISATYHRVVQYESGSNKLLDGRGDPIPIELTASEIQLATDVPNPSWKEGLIFYDSSSKALAVYNDESDITLQVGQEMWVRVYNDNGVPLTNGSAVYISGSTGGDSIPNAYLAQADKLQTSENVVGVATHDIETGSIGYITSFGIVNDIDTSGISEGEVAYLSPTVAGELTGDKPTPPNYAIQVGHVLKSDPFTGRLLLDVGEVKEYNIKTIRVEASGGDFTNVSGAVASINDSSNVNRYVVSVGPGIYYEDNPIHIPTYVSVMGQGSWYSTVLRANNNSENLFTFSNRGAIANLQLEHYGTVPVILLNEAGGIPIENILFNSCSYCIEVDNPNIGVTMYKTYVNYSGGSTDRFLHLKNGTVRVTGFEILLQTPIDTAAIISEGTASDLIVSGLSTRSKNINKGLWVTSGSHADVSTFHIVPATNTGTNSFGILCEGSYNGTASKVDGVALSFHHVNRPFSVNDGGEMHITACDVEYALISAQVGNSGSNSKLVGNSISAQNSVEYDLQVLSPTGEFFGNGNEFDSTKLDVTQSAGIYTSFLSDVTGDEGLNVIGELHVGSPEFPSETCLGEGDSYTRGMLIYTFDTGTLTYKDVTVSGSTIDDGLYVEFTNTGSDNMLYFASTMRDSVGYKKVFGQKMTSIEALETGSGLVIGEYYTAGGWKKYNHMVTEASAEYLPLGLSQTGRTGSFQYRFDWRMGQDWEKNDPVGYGTDLYWTRWRITSPISRSVKLDQVKVHSNRMEINEDGFMEYFGRARPWGTLPWDQNLVQAAAASPGNQDVYLSDTLDVGRLENLFANGATDRIGLNAYLPEDLDTSCPIQIRWSVIGTTTEANNISWNIRWGYSGDGDGVYTGTGDAPTYAGNGSQQSMSISVPPPSALNVQKTYDVDLTVDDMVSRRGSGSFGDMLWVSIERPVGDPYDGNVAIINLTARYTKWCEGGHQF